MSTCTHCDEDISKDESPIDLDGEAYCPQCFVWYIAHTHKHPNGDPRFHAESMIAGQCSSCKKICVTHGVCPQCGGSSIKALQPKADTSPLADG